MNTQESVAEQDVTDDQGDVTETETAEAVADETSSPEVTDDGASSSEAAAEDQEEEGSLLELLEKDGEDKAESAEEPEPEAEVKADEPKAEHKEETDAKSDDGDDEEYRLSDKDFNSLPDGVKKRIGHLNTRLKKTEREMAEVKAQAEQGQEAQSTLTALRTYISDNNMTDKDVELSLDAQAKFNTGDYEGYLSRVQEQVQLAMRALGQMLPDDLKQQVDQGYMTEEAARELTVARSKAETSSQALERERKQREDMAAERAQESASQQILSAVNAREAELRQSDPDYAHKAAAVKANMEFALGNGGMPASPEAAVKMVNDAYALAVANTPKPAPKPTPPRPSASTVSRGKPTPKSTLEAFHASPPPQG